MKVLLTHWGRNGGGPKYALDMARPLNSMKNVELLVSYSDYADNRDDWASLNVSSLPIKTYRSHLEIALGGIRWFSNVIKFRNYALKHSVDVVYSPMLSLWHSLALPILVPRGRFYVSTIHDATEHPGEESPIKRLCQFLEIRRADLVITPSDHVRRSLEVRYPNAKIFTINLGIDKSSYPVRSIIPSDEIIIGFFGRILQYKGIEIYVESLRILRARGWKVRGAVFGNGAVDEELLASSMGFIDWKLGWVDSSELDQIFESFDIVALPYVEASQSGVVSLAAGYGVPVVATPVGGLQSQVSDTGAGTLSREVGAESFADALEDLFSKPDVYQALSAQALAAGTGKHSWESTASRLVDRMSDGLASN